MYCDDKVGKRGIVRRNGDRPINFNILVEICLEGKAPHLGFVDVEILENEALVAVGMKLYKEKE